MPLARWRCCLGLGYKFPLAIRPGVTVLFRLWHRCFWAGRGFPRLARGSRLGSASATVATSSGHNRGGGVVLASARNFWISMPQYLATRRSPHVGASPAAKEDEQDPEGSATRSLYFLYVISPLDLESRPSPGGAAAVPVACIYAILFRSSECLVAWHCKRSFCNAPDHEFVVFVLTLAFLFGDGVGLCV